MELRSLYKATFVQHNVSDAYPLLLLVIPILFLSTVALYDYSTVYLVNEHLGYFQFLPIVSTTAMDISICLFVDTVDSYYLQYLCSIKSL